jgi:hypothetical protein
MLEEARSVVLPRDPPVETSGLAFNNAIDCADLHIPPAVHMPRDRWAVVNILTASESAI